MNSEELQSLLHFFNKTQEQLARDLGVSVTTVSRWCNNHNKPSRLALSQIERVLDGYKQEKYDQERQNKGAA